MNIEKFSRNILLNEIDYSGQERICASSILCIGCGGLASHVIPLLVASGISKVALVDFDTVSISNLPRQTIFREEDIGKKKVDCVKDYLRERNSDCEIKTFCENGLSVVCELASYYDIIIDLTDSMESRLASNIASITHKKPFFTGAAIGFTGHVYSFANHIQPYNYESPSEPQSNFGCYSCLFEGINENQVQTCENAGVFPPAVGMIGGMIAANVLKFLAGINIDFHEFLIFDFIGNNNRKINFFKDETCKACRR